MRNNKHKVILFDFDGTLAPTMEPVLDIINTFSDELKFKKITTKQAVKLRDKGARELLKQFNIPLWKLPFLVARVQKELTTKIPGLKPFPQIKETIKILKKRDFTLGIVTSNSKENVEEFLKNNQLTEFAFVYSEKNIFGKGKVIKNVLKKKRVKTIDTIYIGDEIRDIEAALLAGIKIIAVTWGYNSEKSLKKANPDYLIHNPQDLLRILQ
jgi:phosphoglycolate phosphatase-like HAD superfamily hydrolase